MKIRSSSLALLASYFLASRSILAMAALLRKLEVKPTDDEYETIETSRWGNKDVYPIPHDKRTYGVYAFVAYWGRHSSSTYATVADVARNMRCLSVVMDHREQFDWNRTYGWTGHGCCGTLWSCLYDGWS